MALEMIKLLKRPQNLFLFLGVVFLLMDVNLYFMLTFPGSVNDMCVMGANFSLLNVLFAFLSSALTAAIIVGIKEMFQQQYRKKTMTTTVSSVGLGIGFLTLFCPICALPALSIFGLGIGLDVFNDYNIWFKLLSLLLLVTASYFINQQLVKGCERCVY